MTTEALLVLVFAGCGSVQATPPDGQGPGEDATGDATVDGPPPPPCDLEKPFGAAVEIPNLHNAAFNDTHASLSADERTIFFASDREGTNDFHIYTSTRASASAQFPAPMLVGSLFSVEGESNPAVSADGNTVIFDSFRPAANPQGVVHIFKATRSNITVDFPTPDELGGSVTVMPAITSDGGVVYGANLSSGKLSRFDKVGTGFGAPQDVTLPGAFSVVSPVTNDDLLMFLGKGNSTGTEIISTSRPSTSDPFPEPTRVVELKTSAVQAEPSWLSPDGCRLYLTYREQATDKSILHVATRPE